MLTEGKGIEVRECQDESSGDHFGQGSVEIGGSVAHGAVAAVDGGVDGCLAGMFSGVAFAAFDVIVADIGLGVVLLTLDPSELGDNSAEGVAGAVAIAMQTVFDLWMVRFYWCLDCSVEI